MNRYMENKIKDSVILLNKSKDSFINSNMNGQKSFVII